MAFCFLLFSYVFWSLPRLLAVCIGEFRHLFYPVCHSEIKTVMDCLHFQFIQCQLCVEEIMEVIADWCAVLEILGAWLFMCYGWPKLSIKKQNQGSKVTNMKSYLLTELLTAFWNDAMIKLFKTIAVLGAKEAKWIWAGTSKRMNNLRVDLQTRSCRAEHL